MISKAEEDVRKRRAKGGASPRGVYRKLILLVAVVGVLLAIGISPRMAPLISGGIIGTGVLLFFLLRTGKVRAKEEEHPAPPEPNAAADESRDLPEPLLSEPQEGLPAEKELKEEGTPSGMALPDPPAVEPVVLPIEKGMSLQERLYRMEERLTEVEEKFAKLEEKLAGMGEWAAAPDDKVDLQKIFSQIDETAEKAAKHRSYLVHTDPPSS